MNNYIFLSLNFLFLGFFLISSPASATSTVPTYYSAAPTIKHAPTSKKPPYITIVKAWCQGETGANRENKLSGGGPDSLLTALNDEGRQQAVKLGNLVFQNGVLNMIYKSDLGRDLNTAGAGGKLELYNPQADQEFAPKTVNLADLTELPTSDEAVQRTYLIRHGQSTANVYFEVDGKKVRYVSGQSTEIPLTDFGRQQIIALAENLNRCFSKHAKLVIVSSTAQRTQQTARIIFEELSKTHPNVILANEVYEGLNERQLGAWEGLLKDDNYMKAVAPWKKLSAKEKFISPEVSGGESCSQVASRALLALSEIYSKYAGATVLAVTSFNTINATAIRISDTFINLPTEPETNLPKLNLGNGDLVLFEAETQYGFASTHAVSHIKHTKSE